MIQNIFDKVEHLNYREVVVNPCRGVQPVGAAHHASRQNLAILWV